MPNKQMVLVKLLYSPVIILFGLLILSVPITLTSSPAFYKFMELAEDVRVNSSTWYQTTSAEWAPTMILLIPIMASGITIFIGVLWLTQAIKSWVRKDYESNTTKA